MSCRILVSGMGSIGKRHAKNIRDLGVGEVCTFDPCQKCDFDTYGDALRTVKPDIVLICSPTNLHVPQALQAVKSGCHVFIEKPLSYSMDGIKELEEEANKRNLTTMVGCNMRFHPGPSSINRFIDEGRIGNVISARLYTGSPLPRWRPGTDYKTSYSASPEFGGAILDCIHEIDCALWYFGDADLLGSSMVPATSIGLPDVEGTAEILLQHKRGCLSSIHLNFVQSTFQRFCQVVGGRGMVTWYWDYGKENRVRVYGDDGALCEEIHPQEGWEFNRVYIDEMKHFFDAVSRGEESCAPIRVGCTALEIALEAKQRSLSFFHS